MALIKALETQYGNQVTYWKIIQINQYLNPPTMLVDLVGFVDEAARRANKTPIDGKRFQFSEGDHPLDELNPELINASLLEDWRNFDQHLVYLHIKALALFAQTRKPLLKEGESLTANEQTALYFIGAQDKF